MGVIYWSIRVRMQEVIQNARHDAERAGHAPSDKLGQNSKPMKSLLALGRALVDINLLVFNMGRADYRNKRTLLYMLLIQTSTKPDLGHGCKTALGVVCHWRLEGPWALGLSCEGFGNEKNDYNYLL